jgi:hypothetical protein
MCKTTQKVGSQNAKDGCKWRKGTNLDALRRLRAEELNMENLFGGKYPNSDITIGFSTMIIPRSTS